MAILANTLRVNIDVHVVFIDFLNALYRAVKDKHVKPLPSSTFALHNHTGVDLWVTARHVTI